MTTRIALFSVGFQVDASIVGEDDFDTPCVDDRGRGRVKRSDGNQRRTRTHALTCKHTVAAQADADGVSRCHAESHGGSSSTRGQNGRKDEREHGHR